MSDSQKILFSILGAVVGHLLLFLLLGLLFAVSSLLAPQSGIAAMPAVPAPEEVTILLSDLMEQVELTPKELTQRYMRTDPDQESAVKPKDAPFHSDRNTVLTSERPPDPSSDLEAPTVTSDVNLPVLEIRDRQFVDGDFLDQSATSAPSSAAQAAMPSPTAAQPTLSLNEVTAPKPTPIRDPSEQETEKKLETDATPRPDPKEAPKASPQRPADADTPPDRAAETETQPDSLTITDASVMAQRQESYETPFAAEPVAKARETNESDREAESRKETVQHDEAAAPETPQAASAMPVARPFLPAPPVPQAQPSETQANASASSANLPPSPKPPSDSPAFTPETRAKPMQGNATNIGNTPSFNVESSALGKYKKLVTQAVERQWHRYRERNAEFVTYGNLKVKFRVDREGTPRSVKIVKNEANSVIANFTLEAIRDADIPPMPAEIAGMLGSSGLEITYDVIIY